MSILAPVLSRPLAAALFSINVVIAAMPALVASPVAAQEAAVLSDNAASIAVIIGNRDYRQTVPVDYAHNDAEAMREYLVGTLGYREENVFMLLDGTLSEITQMFGSEAQPQSGRLWRSVTPDASNVFVYYSGHGVPDLTTGDPFLLPSDGDPNSVVSGYRLDTLYRNLELVRHKIGPDREVVVMIDACFTGESGRGDPLLAVSAPGFTPALPDTGEGVVRLVATSGSSPANWDDEAKLGLFTSRFLMGAGGLADAEGTVEWAALSSYLVDAVAKSALRETGRTQVPEIDSAAFALPGGDPVQAVSGIVAKERDLLAWEAARNDRPAIERYIAECETCAYREEAIAELAALGRGEAADADRARWQELSATKDYQAYLDECGEVCSYRDVALSYLQADDPSRDTRVMRCDALAAGPKDPDRPESVEGVAWTQLDGFAAVEACETAVRAYPQERRLHFQLGRALDRLGRFGEALQSYQAGADLGSMAALNGAATLHENGEGVPSSPETAFGLYLKAAEGGDTIAMTNVARMLEYGRGTQTDISAAVSWYQRAADAGDGFAITKLAPYYIEGANGIPKDVDRGIALFQRGIALAEPMAMVTAAVMIDNGFAKYFPDHTSVGLLLDTLAQGETGAQTVVATTAGDLPLSPETIRDLQQELIDRQYFTGKPDGTLNPLFVQAMTTYAKSAASQQGN
jgi:tetratricopeptide (TPR) repeat protein